MHRYYLSLRAGEEFAADPEGIDATSIDEARAVAIRSLRDVIAGDVQRGEINIACCIEIENEERRLIERVRFEQAVTVTT